MKLATYRYDDGIGPGLVEGSRLIDLRPLGASVRALLGQLDGLESRAATLPRLSLDPSRLRAPLRPARFVGVGLNYRDHAAETGRTFGAEPFLFAKLPGSYAPPFGTIPCPPGVTTLDYEGELGVVVGRRCHRVAARDSARFIAGYLIVNDVTVRALSRPETLLLAKNAPGHAPFGPWLTTADEAGSPDDLAIRTWVNGELRQDSRTLNMHWKVAALIELISSAVPLMPGDVITTGSPAGSGAGRVPPAYLAPGDRVRVEIERLGHIEHVVARGGGTSRS